MSLLANRKIVLVIVEGPSDEIALGALKSIYDKDSVAFTIIHGDITTQIGVNSNNIVAKVGNIIRGYAKSRHYKSNYFKEIIHIVDTDGAYIPNDKIIEDNACKELRYETEGIYTNNVDKVIMRNKQKRENLIRLSSQSNIWKIPYSIYYMSCNLDHVLYGKRNCNDTEKENNSYNFAEKYYNNKAEFIKFMLESEFSVNGDYRESWNFIGKEMNSIERNSNLCICIEKEIKM